MTDKAGKKRGPYKMYERIFDNPEEAFAWEIPPSTLAYRLQREEERRQDLGRQNQPPAVEDNSQLMEEVGAVPLAPNSNSNSDLDSDSDVDTDYEFYVNESSGTDISLSDSSDDDIAYYSSDDSDGEAVAENDDGLGRGNGNEGENGNRLLDGEAIRDIQETMAESNSSSCSLREKLLYDVLKIYVQRNATEGIIDDFLPIVNDLIPNPLDKLPNKARSLFAFLDRLIPPSAVKRHFFCRPCYLVLTEGQTACPRCLQPQTNLDTYFVFDVATQIRYYFEANVITNALRPDRLQGSEFRRVKRVLSGKFDLSLAFNTDGLQLVTSAKRDCWPVLFSIAELPNGLRDKCLLFGGLWYARNKPVMNIFLEPVVSQMEEIYKKGVRWVHPGTSIKETTRIAVPVIVCDCPARADCLLLSHASGTYPCPFCEIRTTAIYDENGFLIGGRAYPYLPAYPRRTKRRLARMAEMGENLNKGVRIDKRKKNCGGIKGKTILARLPLINLSKAFVPEVMHSVFLGSFDQMFTGWFFDPPDKSYSISCFKSEINDYMETIKPPDFVHRRPRPIEDHKFYKASEFLFWFFFYSIPILGYYLPRDYFEHFLLFHKGIYLLLQDDPSEVDIRTAENHLNRFVGQLEKYYSTSYLTHNMHQLLHLPAYCRFFGSLSKLWGFTFESFNFIISRSFHGTTNLGVEISNRISRMQRLLPLASLLGRKGSGNHPNIRIRDPQEVQSFYADADDLETIRSHGLEASRVFAKAVIDGKNFTSQLYRADIKTNNYTVEIVAEQRLTPLFGEIKLFFGHRDDFFLFLRPYQCNDTVFENPAENLTMTHVLSVVSLIDQDVILNLNEVRKIRHVVPVCDFIVVPPCSLYKTL